MAVCRQMCTLESYVGPWKVSCHTQTVSSNRYFNCLMSYCLVWALTRFPTCCNILHLQLNCPKENVKLFPVFGILKANPFESSTRKEGMNWLSVRMSNPVWPAPTKVSHGRYWYVCYNKRNCCFSEVCQSKVRPMRRVSKTGRATLLAAYLKMFGFTTLVQLDSIAVSWCAGQYIHVFLSCIS